MMDKSTFLLIPQGTTFVNRYKTTTNEKSVLASIWPVCYNTFEVILVLFYYIRHGDPIYKPDSLTELGVQQAEALSKRLIRLGFDEIYSSTSNRAIMTAQPTCQKLEMEPILLDFANEGHAGRELMYDDPELGRRWLFHNPRIVDLMNSKPIRDLGDRWYDHPEFADYSYEQGIGRIQREADAFFANLGYEHISGTGKYRIRKSNDQRIAFFAHQGFGVAFLSCILDIPYPMFCTHFDLCHTGMTVIEFREYDGFAIPKILTLSSDSHLYKEDLPTKYNNRIDI